MEINHKNRKAKVLFAIGQMGIGGAQKLLVEQINELDRNFFEPYLVTLIPEDEHSFLPDVRLTKENITFFDFSSYFNFGSWVK